MKDTSFLDAILDPINLTPQGASGAFQFLPLDKVDIDPKQPRKHHDEAALQDMAGSILQYGILQPVTVTEKNVPIGEQSRYQIVSGERRYRAAILARDSGEVCQKTGYDLACIPALVVEPLDDVTRLEQQLIENLAREDMDPADTGQAMQQLLDALGCNVPTLARRVGKSPSWVRQVLAFANPDLLSRLHRLGVSVDGIPIAVAPPVLNCSDEALDWMQEQIAQGRTLDRTLLEESKRALAVQREDVQPANTQSADLQSADLQSASGAQSEATETSRVEHTAADAGPADKTDKDEEAERYGDDGLLDEENAGEPPCVETFADREKSTNGSAPVEQYDADSRTKSVYPMDADITITLPESVWQAFLDRAGVMGNVSADTVQQAIDALSS